VNLSFSRANECLTGTLKVQTQFQITNFELQHFIFAAARESSPYVELQRISVSIYDHYN
jgi:hypothetical protein